MTSPSNSTSTSKKNSSLLDLFSSAIPRNVSTVTTLNSNNPSSFLLNAVNSQLPLVETPVPTKSPRPISPSPSTSSIGKLSPSSSTSSIKSTSLTKGLFKSLLSSASSSTSNTANSLNYDSTADTNDVLLAKKPKSKKQQQPISIALRPKETITQELRKNVAISFKSQEISQIKPSSCLSPEDPGCLGGSLLVETSNCIAYAMGSGKIRLISNETGATGVITQHSPSSLDNPIIDLAWSLQGCPPSRAGAPLSHIPSEQILASLTAHGDLCVGSVMAESPTTLRYDSIITTKLPRIQESFRRAAGLAWNGRVERPILAVWSKSLSDGDDDDDEEREVGESEEEIFIIDFTSQEDPQTTAITVKLSGRDGIQSLQFSDDYLYVADKCQVVVLNIGSGLEEGMMNARTIELPVGLERIWILSNSSGTWAIALVDEKLQIISLKTNNSLDNRTVLDVALPGFDDLRLNDKGDSRRASLGLWCGFDSGEGVVVVGSKLSNHSKILCIRLYDSNVIMTVGRLPLDFEGGILTVFVSPQKHNNDGNIYRLPNSTLSLYLYPVSGSLYLTNVMIDWSSTTTLTEPSIANTVDEAKLNKTKKKKPLSPKPSAYATSISSKVIEPVTIIEPIQISHNKQEQPSLLEFGSLIKEEIRVSMPTSEKLAKPVANQLSSLLAPSLVSAVQNSLEGRVLPGLEAVIRESMEMLSKSLHESMMNAWKELFMANLSVQQEYINSSITNSVKDIKDHFDSEFTKLLRSQEGDLKKSEKVMSELSKSILIEIERSNSSLTDEFDKLNVINSTRINNEIQSLSNISDSLSFLREKEEIFTDATTPSGSDEDFFNINTLINVLNNADPKELLSLLKSCDLCTCETLMSFDSEVLLAFLQQLGTILSSPDIREEDYSIVIQWLNLILLGNPSQLNDFASFSNRLALESEDDTEEEYSPPV